MHAIPCLRYHDARAALDWLCRAFGLEKHLVVPGPGAGIAHAELVLGHGMVMLGSAGGPYARTRATGRRSPPRGQPLEVGSYDPFKPAARPAG